ncbi:helix-turn-helix domain-containing protein [Sulfobacillus harzensis]|uniref:Helix-turn-helix transcriptional regulator n=1 Tax=Sulfobacillus harzensis TaxID=2729629 RepID=A0A7Y0L650_9FIRM|nr:helix-turn-helix transcriptional regulator [Sulfobacillus harzensis]
MSDPTRASLLMEIERAGEMTATKLAERLGLTANNVYHHLRVIKRLGILEEPRIVPGPTYVVGKEGPRGLAVVASAP